MKSTPRRLLLLPMLLGTPVLFGCSPGFHLSFAPPPTYTVGGTVTGLAGSGLTFATNGSSIGRGANGTYRDLGLGGLSAGQTYNLAVITQPVDPTQTCVVSNGQGTIGNANVANVQVTCTTNISRYVYVANDGSNSLSTYAIDPASGALTATASIVAAAGPHALAMDPYGRYLYVANRGANSVSVYAIDAADGSLVAVAGSPFPTGAAPSAVAIHPGGRLVYVTNQSDSTISAYSLDTASGVLTEVAGSPFATGSTPLSVTAPDADNPLLEGSLYASTASGGIWGYTIQWNGNALSGDLQPVPGSPFAASGNPVSIAAAPGGAFIFTANQDSTFSVYSVGTGGALTPGFGSPFPTGAGSASVTVDPLGRFAYVSNGVAGTISGYAFNAGMPSAIPGSPLPAGTTPSSGIIDNQGRFLYVANSGSNNLSAYRIDPTTGALTPVSGSPFASLGAPSSIVVGY